MGGFTMRKLHLAASLAAIISLTGCSTFLGGELVREGEQVGQIVIINNSGIAMDVVTLSRCSAMSHGLDILEGTIPSGSQRAWTVGAGCWDIGVGRTGSCSGGRCSWNEAYDQVQVPPGRSVASRWGSNGRS